MGEPQLLMYQDPTMKEIVDDFCLVGDKQLKELVEFLNNLEDDITDKANFEKFGQVIDRMMGAAKSLEIATIGTFCELGKIVGYKASQVDDENLLSIVVAVLFDAVDILEVLLGKLKAGEDLALKEISADAFISRLHWLSEKFKHIKRGSVAFKDDQSEKAKEVPAELPEDLQTSIDDLLKQLGL